MGTNRRHRCLRRACALRRDRSCAGSRPGRRTHPGVVEGRVRRISSYGRASRRDVGGCLVFFVLSAMGRWYFGTDAARSSRYVHIGAALTLPALAVAADTIARRWRPLGRRDRRTLPAGDPMERDALRRSRLRSCVHVGKETDPHQRRAHARGATGPPGRAAASRPVRGS